MDELTFDPAVATDTDTTFEGEGYQDQIEDIKQEYPEEDLRSPLEIEAENQAQQQQQQQTQPTGEDFVNQVTSQVGEQLGIQPEQEQATAPEVEEQEEEIVGPNRYADYVDPTTGTIPYELLQRDGINEDLIRITNAELDYISEEREAFKTFHEAGGDRNLEATLTLINTLNGNENLIARYDRNKDGFVGFSDWFDTSRFKEQFSPEKEREETERWLQKLEDKSIIARIGAQVNFQPMVPYFHDRRRGILAPKDELKGEQLRSTSLAGLSVTTQAIFEAPEKIAAGFHAGITDEEDEIWYDPRTWYDANAAEKHDSVLDDKIMNHKDPLSLQYAINRPINRVWSDPIMFELGRYSPAIAATLPLPGGWTSLSFKGAAPFAGSFVKASAVTWATETIPTNIFADMNHTAMQTFHQDKLGKQLLDNHPELHTAGIQMANGMESPWSRKLEFMRNEMAWDSGGLLASNIILRSIGKAIPPLTRNMFEALKTGFGNKASFLNNSKIAKIQKQVSEDGAEAAIDQGKMAAEGPASKWNDPWDTPAAYDSPMGSYKNDSYMAGQGTVAIRRSVYDVVDQVNELRRQVGIDGGSVDELFTPVERAEFYRRGEVPDFWFEKNVDEIWNTPDFQADLKALKPTQRTIGNLAPDTLEGIKEVMGRDAGRLVGKEFWGEIFNTPLKPGKKLDEVKKFLVKNIQVQDAVNSSLLKRLRDYADATGEQIGKADIFSKDGPMRNVAKNLVLGLTEIKKTKFTWDLARTRMAASGEKLSPAMVKEINQLVAKRSSELAQESQNGVRLMMQVLENSDSDELTEGILEVFKASDNIHNWKDFDAWMRQKISGGEFNGKVKTGVLIKELQGVMINSILSGPKTPMRALVGTTTNAYLNAINEAAGASLTSAFTKDIASRKASMAKLKGMVELVPEAFQLFRKNLKSKWNADLADIRTRYSQGPTGASENWQLYSKWVERNGTLSDKAAFNIANIAKNLNNNKLLSWSPRVLAATDETFKWLLARARSKEIGMREALEVASRDGVEFSADTMKLAEDLHMKKLLDADGNLDLASDAWLNKQFKEVTLTSELDGFSKKLDKVFEETPLIKPFYLFARTGINGLNFTFKNTPLLGALHKESLDILKHTGDDFTPLFKYGIENADDLANARNLFAGRQAVGAATVFTFAMMYQGGQLTGNGPADRKLRQQWINAGWKPNHIYIGDVGFDYSSLEPYNTIFASIADVGDNMELMGSEWAEKRLQATAFVIGRGATSKTYLSGLDQMMQIAQMKPGALDKGAANILNNSVPLAGLRNEFGKFVNPHMRELNSSMWDSIRNRNAATELIALDPLPKKSDLLNGEPINDYNIIHRGFNSVSPIGFSKRSNSPGRKLLLDSNYDLKSATYSYGGYSFAKDSRVRAYFQNAIGTVPITVGFKTYKNVEEALNHLSTKDVQLSLQKMKKDVNNPANWDIDPNTYPHNTLIDQVMNQARAKAWAKINRAGHPGFARIQELKSEADGKTNKTRDNRQEILDLSFPQRSIEDFPK